MTGFRPSGFPTTAARYSVSFTTFDPSTRFFSAEIFATTEHDISGEVLIYLDFDTLREIGITSAGHRLEILKAIYRLKVDSGIPIEPEHYIPLCKQCLIRAFAFLIVLCPCS